MTDIEILKTLLEIDKIVQDKIKIYETMDKLKFAYITIFVLHSWQTHPTLKLRRAGLICRG